MVHAVRYMYLLGFGSLKGTALQQMCIRDRGWTDLNYGNAINYYAGNPDSRAMIDRQYPIHKELVDVCRTGNTEDICRAISNHYMKTIRRRLKEQGMPEDHFKFSIDVIDGWV